MASLKSKAATSGYHNVNYGNASYKKSGFHQAEQATRGAMDGLAISYDIAPTLTTFAPLPDEDSEVSRKQDLSNDRARCDSVFDVYASLYTDERDGDESDAEQDDRTPSPKYGGGNPWDSRAKRGLYGDGGRGADDHETGWMNSYASLDEPLGEEDLVLHDEQEKTVLPSAADSSPESSYGPETPVQEHMSIPQPPKAGAILPPKKQPHSSFKGLKTLRRQGGYLNTETKKPYETFFGVHIPASQAHPKEAPAKHNLDGGKLRKASAKSPRPLEVGSSAPTPPRKASPDSDQALPIVQRSKSLVSKVGLSRARRAPKISNPILPPGFIESLGMETFPLTPGSLPPKDFKPNAMALPPARPQISAPVSRDALPTMPLRPTRPGAGLQIPPKPKVTSKAALRETPVFPVKAKADKQSTVSPRPQTADEKINSRQAPEVALTPLEAIRNFRTKETSPAGAEESRATIVEVFRRLSESSDFSASTPALAKIADAERREYFDRLRASRENAGKQHGASAGSIGSLRAASQVPPRVPQKQDNNANSITSSQPQSLAQQVSAARQGQGFANPWSRTTQATPASPDIDVSPESKRGKVVSAAQKESQRDSAISVYSTIDDDEVWDDISPLETARPVGKPSKRRSLVGVAPAAPARTSSRVASINQHKSVRPVSASTPAAKSERLPGTRVAIPASSPRAHAFDQTTISFQPLSRDSWGSGGPHDTSLLNASPAIEPVGKAAAMIATPGQLFRNPFQASYQAPLIR